MARPVMVHTTMVSQKVPVILMYAWRTGWSVVAAAAVIAADPMPASLENTPRATPKRMAFIMDAVMVPQSPPPTACTLKAILKIMETPAGRLPILPMITLRAAII